MNNNSSFTQAIDTIDPDNAPFKQAVAFVLETDENLFLTGKAGSGKTTFLKYIKSQTTKKCAVVAPTGIAAINAGGETMHSFLQLPLGPFVPAGHSLGFESNATTKSGLLSRLRMRETKIALLQKLELLIIDEVSMVRADLLDAADAVLRHVRKRYNEPFGGVQMLFIGDMYQLPPVIPQEEWSLLSHYYKGLYFFDAQVIQQNPPLYLELTKIYRQKDEVFIGLLNRVRIGQTEQADLQVLNQRHRPNPEIEQGYVVLCTHNQLALGINLQKLASLPGKGQIFEGRITLDFGEKNLPVDQKLELKPGAQVMFIKNDTQTPRRYYNGKIGTVHSITNDEIYISFPGDGNKEPLKAELETWKNIRYALNAASGEIVEEELGAYSQYPLRLAWAITVHKSQGLTLEKVIVDLQNSFAPGQVYVALSRCTSLGGIVLASPISMHNIMVDPRVHQNMAFGSNTQAIDDLLQVARLRAVFNSIVHHFSFTDLANQLVKITDELKKAHKGPVEQNTLLCAALKEQLDREAANAVKFHAQARLLFEQHNDALLKRRASDACRYFTEHLLMPVLQQLKEHILLYEGMQGVSKQVKLWNNYKLHVKAKLDHISRVFS